MNKSNQNISFQGNKLTVLGKSVEEGAQAPSFTLTATDMQDVSLDTYKGKVLAILSIPSVDTPVCATETKRFNEFASSLSDDVVILAVSMDLPFAQTRWCAAEGVDAVTMASDYKHRSFGENYGTFAQEMGLLARAVFVVDQNGSVKHVEYVTDIAEEPNYDAAIAAIKELC